jgi:hypothetical protein
MKDGGLVVITASLKGRAALYELAFEEKENGVS